MINSIELVNRGYSNVVDGASNKLKLSKGTLNGVTNFSNKHQMVEKVKADNSYDVVSPESVVTLNEPAKGLRVNPELVSKPKAPVYQNTQEDMIDRVRITGNNKNINGKMEFYSEDSNEINVGNIAAQNIAAPSINNAFAAKAAEIKPVETAKLDSNINDNNLISYRADVEDTKIEVPSQPKTEEKDVFSVLKKVEESSPVQPSVNSINKLTNVESLKRLKEELEIEKQRKAQLEAERTAKADQLSKTKQEAELYMKKLLSELKNDNASTEKSIQDIDHEVEEVESFVGEYKNQESSRTR